MRSRHPKRSLLATVFIALAALFMTTAVAPAATAATSSISVTPGQGKSLRLVTGTTDTSHAAFKVAKLPASGASLYLGARTRVASGAYYMAQARVQSNGTVSVSIKRTDATGKTVNLAGPTNTAVTVAAGNELVVQLVSSGSSSVSLAASVQNLTTKKVATQKATDSSSLRRSTAAGADAWVYSSSNATSTVTVPVRNQGLVTATTDGGATAAKPATGAGVPAGTNLTVHKGDLIITKANTVVRNMEVHGFIRVNAPGVVIENSLIIGRSTTNAVGIVSNYNNGNSFTIRNSEIRPAAATPYLNGIMGHNFTASNVWVHGLIDSVRITGSNVTVKDSVLEDNVHFLKDPTQGNTPSHDDSIQIQGGSNIKITGNRITGAHNAAIQITQGLSRVSNVTISGNYLNDGGCTINIHETGKGVVSGVSISNNVFGPDRRVSKCAVVAPTSSYPKMTSNTWETITGVVGITRG